MENVDERWARLEEAQMFLDRRSDLLGEQMLELSRALDRLSRRIDALETRLGGVEARTKPEVSMGEDGLNPDVQRV